MKPKEAARIFDRLDMKILVEVSTQMKPATMSAILAQMTPEAAERLTVELANRASTQKTTSTADALPQIEGKPGTALVTHDPVALPHLGLPESQRGSTWRHSGRRLRWRLR